MDEPMFILGPEDICPGGKNRHDVGNSPNFCHNCFIVDPDAPDMQECPLCVARANRSDDILDADLIG